MTLRKRLSWIAAASVAIAVTIAVGACYAIVRSQIRGQVTDSLNAQMAVVQQLHEVQRAVPGNAASSGGPAPYNQVVLTNGAIYTRAGGVVLPISAPMRKIAATGEGTYLTDVWVGGSHLRLLAFAVNVPGFGGESLPGVLELARPLNGVDSILRHLRLFLALLVIGGVALAAALGRMASRRVLAPLGEVADVAQEIAETEDLTKRLHVRADDEVGQLATNFNHMLDRLEASREALDDSVRAQRQLVADASHELRTPVTSLRTNIEVLLEEVELEPEDRRRLLADVVEQSEELTALVGDLIELARGDQPGPETDDVRLDGVAAESLARARRNAPGIHFDATLVPTVVDGVPERLARAINNLLDNAARHSPPGGTVELQVGPSGVEVRDHGTGVDPEDLPYVFDRFFRGRNSRGRQGSGLGLSIVRQVAEQHDGTASVANAVDGGAIFTLHLPGGSAEDVATDSESDQLASPGEPVGPVESR
ncbi:MAG TPA: HAMP domain-containing sensor histidine kinase [Solirubrobacteraceae bacterium]|jgi:two-component system sensor histidine kinase MprB|nr:HAMP domain-containing sensor histidine kinase [Solirubrobacteraceae bacterium]